MTPPVRRGAMRRRLIFALDVASVSEALGLVDLLKKEVGLFKVGVNPSPAFPDMAWSGGYRETGGAFWWAYEYAFKPLTATIGRGDAMAIMRVVVMMLTSTGALAVFIKSFVDARRAKK